MPNDSYFRNQIAVELERLAQILLKNGVVTNTKPISDAAMGCRSSGPYDGWAYRLERLIIHSIGNIKSIPSGVRNITLEITISVTGHCNPEDNCDPFSELALEIEIQGELEKQPVRCSWHLDRHISSSSDGVPEFTHPRYHFHFGGKAMMFAVEREEKQNVYGSTLIMDSPRLAYPPMEALIGIDFVLTNFINSEMLDFRQEGEYRNLLQQKQEQIWKPYIHSLYHAWENVRDDYPWQPTDIWPQLFPLQY